MHTRTRQLIALLVAFGLALVYACGDSQEDAAALSPDDASVEAGTTDDAVGPSGSDGAVGLDAADAGLPVAQYCDSFVENLVVSALACKRLDGANEASYRASLRARCDSERHEIDTGRSAYDPVEATACLGRLLTSPCNVDPELVCAGAVHRQGRDDAGVGATCSQISLSRDSVNCATGLFCDWPNALPKLECPTCKPKGEPGQPCSGALLPCNAKTAYCGPANTCLALPELGAPCNRYVGCNPLTSYCRPAAPEIDTGTCVAPGALDAGCADCIAPSYGVGTCCAGSLECNAFVCRAVPGLGDPCAFPNPSCAAGVCSARLSDGGSTTATCVAASPAADGLPCGKNIDCVSRSCASTAIELDAGDGGSVTAVAALCGPLPLGAPCDPALQQCESQLYCASGDAAISTCAPRLALGSACSNPAKDLHGFCALNLFCRDAKCAPTGPTGKEFEACGDNGDCDPSFFCAHNGASGGPARCHARGKEDVPCSINGAPLVPGDPGLVADRCDVGFKCASGGVPQCVKAGARGEPCTAGGCQSGLQCALALDGGSACTPFATTAQPCGVGVAICATGSCISGACQAALPLGGVCTRASDCTTGRCELLADGGPGKCTEACP